MFELLLIVNFNCVDRTAMNYKAVIFDMGGVIMNYARMPYIETFFELAKKESSIQKAWHDMETGKLIIKDGDDVFRPIFDQNDKNFAAVLPKLRSLGYRLGLLTNNVFRTPERKRSVIIEDAVKKFDVVVESCREGIRKPDPRIYLLAASRLSVDPKMCIFLDDFAENCKGAESVGMKAIQLDQMESVVHNEEVLCYDTLESCREQCENSDCIQMENCSGSGFTQYACLPINLQFIGWLIFGIFLVVVTCCSSLVACYACQLFPRQTRRNEQVVFYRNKPKYSRSLPHRLDELSRDDDIERLGHYSGYRRTRERY